MRRDLKHIPSCHRKKFDLTADEAVFVSYTEAHNTFPFKNSSCPRMSQKSRDVFSLYSYFKNKTVNNGKTSTEPFHPFLWVLRKLHIVAYSIKQ